MILTKKKFEKILKTNSQSRKKSKNKIKKYNYKSRKKSNKLCNNYTLKQKGGILGFGSKNNDEKIIEYKEGIEKIKNNTKDWEKFFEKLYEKVKIFDDEGITAEVNDNLELNITIFLEFLKNQKSQVEKYMNSNYLNTENDQTNSNIPLLLKIWIQK